jgi:putative intracellular protease/amidase
MKRLAVIIILSIILFSCSSSPRVLLFVKDKSPELRYMLTHEVGNMKKILEESGYKVTIATVSGKEVKTDSVDFKPDIRLSDARTADYDGFILPCMASDTINAEAVELTIKAVSEGKPVAAQLGSVLILGEAGLLKGKKFAFAEEYKADSSMYLHLKDGIFSGKGVVQDGLIITSGICPWMAKMREEQDGTSELTLELVNVMKSKKK